MNLHDRSVVLGVTGGVAAYKSAELVRTLRQKGARVRVVMTRAAQQFITPLTLQTLSGQAVSTDLWDLTQESQIGHIDLADSAEVLLVAPATANVIAKLANGIADDLLSTIALATRARLVVAPAMNVHMYESPVVQENLERLRRRGARIVAPDSGSLACGYEGLGRLPDPDVLVEEVRAALAPQDMAGETVLVTAGPTREYLDPVRFLSNRSSGKMGFSVARAAARRGARVVLVTGPTMLAEPRGLEVVRVETAAEMARAVDAEARTASVVVAAAAVADYRPKRRADEKAAKVKGGTALQLETTRDIVATIDRSRPGRIIVGFAAETGNPVEKARGKLERKRLDLIVANDVTATGAGFDVETNVVTLIDSSGVMSLPLLDKDDVADAILDRVAALRAARTRPARAPGRKRAKGRSNVRRPR
ncbi:MAG: bifunctional phosphopantothenoylcysteine decarboxylase/phosphopantothenate--cysteine ligase CoaBC [Deltaproteobacteria bacterium]|nr:bifunctional phosphopantothenoylcysteine decarboxylase/phosphopantothenate--cysteine ligase CoaBC [Deltaproteobacteria bacterium]